MHFMPSYAIFYIAESSVEILGRDTKWRLSDVHATWPY